MNWLKKLGEAVKTIGTLVPMFKPFTVLIPGDKDDKIIAHVSDTFEQVGAVIMQAEIFGAALGLPGKDKLTGAAPAVAQIILRSSLLAGKKVKDQARFEAAVIAMASATAELLSSVEEE